MGVGEDLDLNVAGALDVALDQERVVAETGALPTYPSSPRCSRWSGSASRAARSRPARRPRAAPARGRHGRDRPLRAPARVLVGGGRADRGRGDLERRQRVQASAGEERGTTLVLMGGIAIASSSASRGSPSQMHARRARPSRCSREIARATFPAGSRGPPLLPRPGLTFAILVLAANTSYQGFPRLGAVLARDRFFPRQFVNLGDRLVYSNGIVVLARLAALLIWRVPRERQLADPPVRDRRLHRVHALAGGDGALLARRRGPGWRGARARQRRRRCCTGLVTLLVVETKFTEGAWAVDRRDPAARARLPPASAATTGASRGGSGGRAERSPPRRRRRTRSSSSSRRGPRARRGDLVRAARSPVTTSTRSTCRARARTPGIRARFRNMTDIRPDLELLPAEDGRAESASTTCGRSARRVELRHGRRAGALRAPSLARRAARRTSSRSSCGCSREPGVVITDVPPRGRRRRTSRRARRLPRAHLRRPRGLAARDALRGDARLRRHAGGLLLLRRRRDAADPRREWDAARVPMGLEIEQAPFATSATRCCARPRASRRTRRRPSS